MRNMEELMNNRKVWKKLIRENGTRTPTPEGHKDNDKDENEDGIFLLSSSTSYANKDTFSTNRISTYIVMPI